MPMLFGLRSAIRWPSASSSLAAAPRYRHDNADIRALDSEFRLPSGDGACSPHRADGRVGTVTEPRTWLGAIDRQARSETEERSGGARDSRMLDADRLRPDTRVHLCGIDDRGPGRPAALRASIPTLPGAPVEVAPCHRNGFPIRTDRIRPLALRRAKASMQSGRLIGRPSPRTVQRHLASGARAIGESHRSMVAPWAKAS